MKSILLMAFFALSTLTLSAQTEQGKVLFGGQFQFTYTKSIQPSIYYDYYGYASTYPSSQTTRSFTILPTIGYFVGNNIAFGTAAGYTYSKTGGSDHGAIVVSPFSRFYRGLGSRQFKFFGQLSVPMAFSTDKGDDSEAIGVAFSPGFAFFPAKKYGIELAFNGISYMKSGEEKSVQIGDDFFTPKIGLQFYF